MLKSKLNRLYFATVFILLVTGIASAGLVVGGAILEKEIVPGEHLSHVMTVQTRESDPAMDIKVSVLGYGQSLSEKIDLNASQDTSPYTARTFLKVSPNSFHLDPGKSIKVTLDGDIPKDVGSGGRYAVINIQSLPIGNGTLGYALAVDVPVILTINGSEILEKGEIENLSIVGAVSAEKQKLSLIFKNTGNHHYKAETEAVVKDQSGNIMANASIPMFESVLPTYSRLITLSITPKTPLRPGTYNVNTTVSLDDGAILATKETSFEVKS